MVHLTGVVVTRMVTTLQVLVQILVNFKATILVNILGVIIMSKAVQKQSADELCQQTMLHDAEKTWKTKQL